MKQSGYSDFYEQIDLFERPKYKITKPIRLIELFGGIGAQAKSLERLEKQGLCKLEHHRLVEFDAKACAAYNAIHDTNFEPLDVTKVKGTDLGITDTGKYCYILTYSFPCQALSLAGLQKGMAEGSGTTSSLLWEVKRILEELKELGTLPSVLLMENVTQVHGKKNVEHFNRFISFLNSIGYSSYWQDMNAKNYGIPQNRDRTFMISFLGDWSYEFPKPVELNLRLKDMLEDEVDEKYYLTNERLEMIKKWNSFQNPLDKVFGKDSVVVTITTRVAESDGGGINASSRLVSKDFDKARNIRQEARLKPIGNIYFDEYRPGFDGNVLDISGISQTLKNQGGCCPHVMEYDDAVNASAKKDEDKGKQQERI